MTRKLISLFLCAAMAAGSLSVLMSCADTTDTKEPTQTNDSSGAGAKKIPDSLNYSSLDEENRTINIAYVEGGNGTLTEHSLVVDDSESDSVDKAVFTRNKKVEAQLGITLYAHPVADNMDGLAGAVETDITSNTGDWDVLAGYQYFSIGMAKKGYLLNLANLSALDADFIDLEAPYWGTAYNEAISYKGAYYWITGDIALRYMGGLYCTFVNSDIYSQRLQDKYGSIYDIARQGQWTLDKLIEMSALCADDTGEALTEEDTVGFGFETCDILDGMAFASGVQFSTKDPNTGAVTITLNNAHTLEFADKLHSLLNAKTSSYNYGNDDSTKVMPAFAEGKVAFTVNKIFQSQNYLDSLSDFYIIPAPKYDENQANYITGIHDGCTIFGIPISCHKVPQTAATLELLAYYSKQDVYPVYYEMALKSRYTRDPEAAEMIELIHNTVTTDFAAAWSESIENIVQIFRTTSKVSKNTLKSKQKPWETRLKGLADALDEARDNAGIA